MQIASVPLPLATSLLPQDVAARAVVNVQAAAPISATAVEPPAKGDRVRRKPQRNEKAKEESPESPPNGHTVNIKV